MSTTDVELKSINVDNLDTGTLICTNITLNGNDIDQYVAQGEEIATYFSVDMDTNSLSLQSAYNTLKTTPRGGPSQGIISAPSGTLSSTTSVNNLTSISSYTNQYMTIANNASNTMKLDTTSSSGRWAINKSTNPTAQTVEVQGTMSTNGVQQNGDISTYMINVTSTSTASVIPLVNFLSPNITNGGYVNLVQGRSSAQGSNNSTLNFQYSGDQSTSNVVTVLPQSSGSGINNLYLYNDRLVYAGSFGTDAVTASTGYFSCPTITKTSTPVMAMIVSSKQSLSNSKLSLSFGAKHPYLDDGTTTISGSKGIHSGLGLEYDSVTRIMTYTGTTTRFFRVNCQVTFTHEDASYDGKQGIRIRDSANDATYLCAVDQPGTDDNNSGVPSLCLKATCIWKATANATIDFQAYATDNQYIEPNTDTAGRWTYFSVCLI